MSCCIFFINQNNPSNTISNIMTLKFTVEIIISMEKSSNKQSISLSHSYRFAWTRDDELLKSVIPTTNNCFRCVVIKFVPSRTKLCIQVFFFSRSATIEIINKLTRKNSVTRDIFLTELLPEYYQYALETVDWLSIYSRFFSKWHRDDSWHFSSSDAHILVGHIIDFPFCLDNDRISSSISSYKINLFAFGSDIDWTWNRMKDNEWEDWI